MNKRQYQKLLVKLVAKILAKSKNPSLNIKATRAEKRFFKKHQAFVKSVTVVAHEELEKG